MLSMRSAPRTGPGAGGGLGNGGGSAVVNGESGSIGPIIGGRASAISEYPVPS